MGAKHSHPTINDGRLTDDQIMEAFRLLDADDSHELDAGELLSAMRNLGFGEMSPEDLNKMMESIDSDGDCKISPLEFTKMMHQQADQVDTPLEAQRAFELIDFTQTGKVTFRSLRKVLSVLQITASDTVVRQMIAELDDDGDGVVTMADFVRELTRPTEARQKGEQHIASRRPHET